MKVIMAPDCSCRHPCKLAFFLIALKSLLSQSIGLFETPKCVMKKSKSITKRYDYYFHVSVNGKFNLLPDQFFFEKCHSDSGVFNCTKLNGMDIFDICERFNTNHGFLCKMNEIDASRLLANTAIYQFSSIYNVVGHGHNVTAGETVLLNIIPCECENFSFDPNLNISFFPLLGKAEVNIKPFQQPKLDIADFKMTIIPNKSLIITKDSNKFQYQLSNIDKCQKYSVEMALQLKTTSFKRKCQNDWKMKPGFIEFKIPEVDKDKVKCSQDLTHIKVTSTSSLNSHYNYSLRIGHESFKESFTSDMSVFAKAGNTTTEDQIGFVSLCDCNCGKCGTEEPILCLYKMQCSGAPSEDLNKAPTSVPMVLIIIGISVGAVLIMIATAACMRYRLRKVKRTDSSREPLAPQHNRLLNDLNENGIVEPANNPELIFEEVNSSHIYDNRDVELDNSPALSEYGN